MPAPSNFSVAVPAGTLDEDELALVVHGGDERRADDAHLQAGDCEPVTVPCTTAAPVTRDAASGAVTAADPPQPAAASATASPARNRHTNVLATHDMASFLLAARLTPRGWGPRCSASPGCPGFALSRRSIVPAGVMAGGGPGPLPGCPTS